MFGFLAQLLAWCFDVVPNYAIAIVLMTLIVMAVVTPFTIKGMRSAAEMSRLQPEMKKLQEQYKNDRMKQNEEVQALFKEHGVNPLGGCLPTLLPLPIFFIIFELLRGLSQRHNGTFAPLVRVLRHQIGGAAGYVSPKYLTYKSSLTQHLIANNGVMKSFGVDLGLTARDHHSSVASAIPYYALIVIMTACQYWQTRQINQRNPAAAQANPQMKLTMQIFPAFYALISLSIPASVVFYLLISGLYRMAQNSISYRFDPVLARAAVAPAVIEAKSKPAESAKPALAGAKGGGNRPQGGANRGPSGRPQARQSGRVTPSNKQRAAQGPAPAPADEAPVRKGLLASLRDAAAQAKEQQAAGGNGRGRGGSRTQEEPQKKMKDRAEGAGEQPQSKPQPAPAPAPQRAPAPASPPAAASPAPAPGGPEPVPAGQGAAAPDGPSDSPMGTPPSVAPADTPARPAGSSPLSVRPTGRAGSGDRRGKRR